MKRRTLAATLFSYSDVHGSDFPFTAEYCKIIPSAFLVNSEQMFVRWGPLAMRGPTACFRPDGKLDRGKAKIQDVSVYVLSTLSVLTAQDVFIQTEIFFGAGRCGKRPADPKVELE